LNFIINPEQIGMYDITEITIGRAGSRYYGRGFWFTGNRSLFANLFLLSSLFLFLLTYHENKQKISKLLYVWLAFGIFMSAYSWSSTSIVVLVVLALYFLLHKYYKFNIYTNIVFAILFCVVIVFIRLDNFEAINDLVVNRLHREMTYSGRIYIWDGYLQFLRGNNIWFGGYGYDLYNIEMRRNFYPHNWLISLLYDYGIFGTTIFSSILIMAVRQLNKYKNSFQAQYVSFTIALYLVYSTFCGSILWVLPYLSIAYNIRHFILDNAQSEKLMRS
jgi:hypothetical protein